MIKTILKEINKKIDNYNKHYNTELGEEIKNNLLSLEIEKIGDFKEFLEFINNNRLLSMDEHSVHFLYEEVTKENIH